MANNLTCLLDNLRRNHYERAEVFPVGMAAEPGVRTLYGAATGASLNTGWAGVSEQYATTIPVNTLDNVLRGRFAGERLFVKMDIEGAEWECLQGAVETLDRSPAPAWLIEICLTENLAPGTTNPHFGDVFTLFRAHGYACHTVDSERREVTETDVTRWVASGHRDFGTYNFLFTRDQAAT
jgi:FkbM family methyltransferase